MASVPPGLRIRQFALLGIVAPIVGVAVNYFTAKMQRPLPMAGVYAAILLFIVGFLAAVYALLKRNQDPVRPPTIPALVGLTLSGGMLAFTAYVLLRYMTHGS